MCLFVREWSANIVAFLHLLTLAYFVPVYSNIVLRGEKGILINNSTIPRLLAEIVGPYPKCTTGIGQPQNAVFVQVRQVKVISGVLFRLDNSWSTGQTLHPSMKSV